MAPVIPEGWALSNVVPIPFVGAGASLSITPGPLVFVGFAVIETTGAAGAQFDFVNGTTNNGQTVVARAIGLGQSDDFECPDGGLYLDVGLFVNMLAGSIRGTVFIRHCNPVRTGA